MDIEDTVSIQETARRLEKSTKTIYRWIAQGKLPAVKVGMQYFIKVDVVEALKSGQVVQRDDVVQRLGTMDTRMQAIEYRLGNLERRMDAQESRSDEMSEATVPLAEVSPIDVSRQEQAVRIEAQPQTGTLPEGHINYTQFYRDHGITSGVADRARGKHFPVVTGPWHDAAGHQITLALDVLGQWNFCVYFKSRGKLRECSRQGCACHEV